MFNPESDRETDVIPCIEHLRTEANSEDEDEDMNLAEAAFQPVDGVEAAESPSQLMADG
ncbi:GD24630 [Drosophila simulans]|uniref:GD24630 n=1 Tax=Drosophila simulans TaxID=7240 RepID=B4NTV9_DROSI|nr:GD24630 [Drosophila simulans]